MLFTYAHCSLETNEHTHLAEGNPDVLYVNRGECETGKNLKEVKLIKRPDGTTSFKVLSIK